MTQNLIATRRAILGGAAASGLLPGLAQAQAPTPIDVLLNNATVLPPLKATLEQEANVRITDGPWQSSTDVVSRVSAPGGTSRWDLVSSSFDFSRPVLMGARAGDEKVRPIDLSLIPNLAHLTPESRAGGIAERGGNTYMLPLYWGFDSVLFNRDVVPEADPFTQSWAPLFEDKYAGRIGWWDIAHQMLMAAGLYMGHAEPEKMDRAQLNEVTRFLISRKRNVRTMYTTFAQGSALLASGEIVCGYGIVPMRVELQTRGFPISQCFPKEGVLSLILAAYIPKDARQPAAAARVINSILGERYGSQVTRATGYLSASKLGEAGLSAEERRSYGFGMFDGSVKNYLLKFPTNMNMWIEAWSRVKSA
ncbi:MAG: extracellular solute-binding protein [Roseococcus sp.]|nr:extracellular solute-binding protein [Roseococcus sp.]